MWKNYLLEQFWSEGLEQNLLTSLKGYFNKNESLTPQPANTVFSQALNLMKNYPNYHYSICEMSFLEAFHGSHLDAFEEMKALGLWFIC